MKPTKEFERGGKRENRNGNTLERMSVLKVLCKHVCNYHEEILILLMYVISKIKLKLKKVYLRNY